MYQAAQLWGATRANQRRVDTAHAHAHRTSTLGTRAPLKGTIPTSESSPYIKEHMLLLRHNFALGKGIFLMGGCEGGGWVEGLDLQGFLDLCLAGSCQTQSFALLQIAIRLIGAGVGFVFPSCFCEKRHNTICLQQKRGYTQQQLRCYWSRNYVSLVKGIHARCVIHCVT